MRRLLNVKVLKTRGLENMLIIVFILPSRTGLPRLLVPVQGEAVGLGMGLVVGGGAI